VIDRLEQPALDHVRAAARSADSNSSICEFGSATTRSTEIMGAAWHTAIPMSASDSSVRYACAGVAIRKFVVAMTPAK
jgi:hypothetical protein